MSEWPQLERKEHESAEDHRDRLERLLKDATGPEFWPWYEARRYCGAAPRALPAAREAYERFLKEHRAAYGDGFLAAVRGALEKLV